MVFQSSLGIATERYTGQFYKPGGQIANALVLSPSKIIQKVVRAEVFVQAIKGDFEMYREGVKPLKATGTLWIDHCIPVMGRLDDEIGQMKE